jgi:aspartyl-tRNA(Asn)/glutamyl-tRNA(Gln) amidotransferase subunit A
MPLTLHAAAEELRSRRQTPLDLLDICLDRIDKYEEKVRAWVFVDWDGARSAAERATNEIQAGHWRGPLHGIPLGIKDIFDVFDWPTACGSKLWSRAVARRDATVVERLRRAGAVFLGKTVTTQYASFDPPITKNPWNPERTPGGSSSGSAAALACGMCLGALASQTGGSITRPASYCGVPGIKPTYGRVSGEGVLTLAASMDHPGPMARCIRDLAILLQTIQGPDFHDPTTHEASAEELLGVAPPQPVRLGRLRGLFEEQAEPAVRTLLDEMADRFRSADAEVIEVPLPAAFAEVVQRHRTIMAVEAAAFHEPRLRRHPDDYGPCITQLLEEGLACPAPEYARCKEHQRQLTKEMHHCFADVDALLMPATPGPAPAAATTGPPTFNSPWSYTGLPVVSLPAGRSDDGLPLCIQLVGPHWSEPRLLAVAEWCEAQLGIDLGEPPL